ncbi:MAG: TetR/AcrR family transcriptional regulator [Pseudomonadota bacterium]
MPRPQNYSESEVVHQAMHLFWSQGYTGTGMSQLLSTTGLKPGSFYNRFDSKKALFIRCLQQYNESVVGERVATHLGEGEAVSAIEGFFVSAFEPLSTDQLIGCLLTNTATELGTSDLDISKTVWSGMQRIHKALSKLIQRGQQEGTIERALDANDTAMHLLSCFQGMSVIGRLTKSKPKMRQLTQSALAILQPGTIR